MKITSIAILAFSLCAATPAFSQIDAVSGATQQVQRVKKAKQSLDEIAKHQTAHMTKALDLTKAQQVKVQAIVKKYAALKRTKENFAKKDAEIEALLTPEQKSKYADFKKQVNQFRKRK